MPSQNNSKTNVLLESLSFPCGRRKADRAYITSRFNSLSPSISRVAHFGIEGWQPQQKDDLPIRVRSYTYVYLQITSLTIVFAP